MRKAARMNVEEYARLFGVLQKSAQTTAQLAEDFNLKPENMREILLTFYAKGLIYVSSWHRVKAQIAYMPVWFFGEDTDAPYPGQSMPANCFSRHLSRINAIAVAEVIRALKEGKASIYDIAEASGLTYHKAAQFVRAARKCGYVRVAAWERSNKGPALALYSLGRGPSANRIPKLTVKQLKARVKEKQEAKAEQTKSFMALPNSVLMAFARKETESMVAA